MNNEEWGARAILAERHAEHREDRIKSIAMNLAAMTTKAARDKETKRITERFNPVTATAIIETAKKLYSEYKN